MLPKDGNLASLLIPHGSHSLEGLRAFSLWTHSSSEM
jgi:hypothetical protein